MFILFTLRRFHRYFESTVFWTCFGNNEGLEGDGPLPRDSSLERGIIGAPPPLMRDSDYRFTAAEVERLLDVREKMVRVYQQQSVVGKWKYSRTTHTTSTPTFIGLIVGRKHYRGVLSQASASGKTTFALVESSLGCRTS